MSAMTQKAAAKAWITHMIREVVTYSSVPDDHRRQHQMRVGIHLFECILIKFICENAQHE